MPSSARTFVSGNFDVFDEIAELFVGWAVPGGPHTSDVLRYAGLAAHTRMLDVGCGTGRLLAQAARREPSAVLVGVDNDRDSIAIARDRARTAPAPIELHLASAVELPFADGSFDVVTAIFVIGDLATSPRAQVLAEIRRVLEPTGRLLVLDWARGGCTFARLAADALAMLPVPRRERPSSGRASRILDAAGFDDVESPRRYCTLAGAAELTVARRPFAD
jgi:SAM-dependent methyltransferase